MVTQLLIASIASTCHMKVGFLRLVFKLMRLPPRLVRLPLLMLPRMYNNGSDSCANSHITNDVGQLHNPREYHGTDQISGVHGGPGLQISKIGDSFLHTKIASFHLHNTLFFTQASTNVISLNHFVDDNDCFFTLHPRFYRE